MPVSVPKPTQVDEKSILRRSGELPLRNSTNWPRNFGRRGAPTGEGLAPEAGWSHSKVAQATVY